VIRLGINDASLAPGDHVCALFRGAAGRDDVLLPFLQAAREQGDKVVGLLEEFPPETVLDRLDPRVQRDDGRRFDLFSVDDTYLAGGRFCREDVLRFWADQVTAASAEPDWRYVRTVGDMAWALQDAPGVEDLARYESELNLSVWQHGSKVSMCLYDLERFVDGALVMEIMRTHPKVLLGGVVLENPWYCPPAEAVPAG
jgi:hypothetical protein